MPRSSIFQNGDRVPSTKEILHGFFVVHFCGDILKKEACLSDFKRDTMTQLTRGVFEAFPFSPSLFPISWNQCYLHGDMEPTELKDRAIFIQALQSSYSDLLPRSLQGKASIPLSFYERLDMTHSLAQGVLRLSKKELQGRPLPLGTTILEAYDAAGQALLILGDSGAGKSTLLLELACNLLQRAEAGHHVASFDVP